MLFPIALALFTAALIPACTRDEGKAPARATVTPPPKPTAVAGAPGSEAEDLYVDVEAEPDEGAPPLTVRFSGSVDDATPPLTYKWDFGDGSPPSTESSPTHVYEKAGEYTATVSVKDAKGKTGQEEADIFVETE
jgi:PKD repeat protein